MLVLLRTVEVLLLLGALGLPLNLLLLRRVDHGGGRRPSLSRVFLAPATGLAVFAVGTGCCYAGGWPVATFVPSYWLLLALLWAGVFVRHRQSRRHNPSAPAAGNVGPLVIAGGWAALGLLAVLGFYLWPCLLNPELVFWHYAGSDGYMYMRIAEHVASPGAGVVPHVDAYDGAAGFVAAEIRLFQAGGFTDKPGTMSTLAGAAGLLGLTPHETFSPLNAAALGTFYLVLVAFGQALLRLPPWAALVFGVLGTCAMPVWMLGNYTFLGNVLALPFYPLALLVLRPFMRRGLAVYLGLILGAQTMIFPDGVLALVGLLAVTAPYAAFVALRKRRLGRFLEAGGLAIVIAGLVISPFGTRMFVTAFARLQLVFTLAFPASTLGPAATGPAVSHATLFKPLATVDWIWPALNLNNIPPLSLAKIEARYLLGLVGLLLLFAVASVWRRRAGLLLCYLLGFGLLLLIGLGGFFKSDYELFRGLAVFAFVPLAAVCAVPWTLVGWANSRRSLISRGLLILALAPLLWHFLQNDLRHARTAWAEHNVDAQYTAGDLRDRAAIAGLGRSQSLTLTSETASFTAFANMLMLFSNTRVGVPESYRQFVFFEPIPFANPEAPYASDLVIRNLRYIDIAERMPAKSLLSSPDFAVVPNDLEPFFDNNTFPLVNGYPAEFLRQRHLVLTRQLSQKTVIRFFSQSARPIIVELQLDNDETALMVPCAIDQEPGQRVAVRPVARTRLLSLPIARGLHTLTLGPVERPVKISLFHLYEIPPALVRMPLTGRWYEYKTLHPDEQVPFQFMNPRPSRFFSTFGPGLDATYYNAHPETRLCFPVPAGHHRLQTSVLINPAAYENLPGDQATDGVQVEIAIRPVEGPRTVIFQRIIDPSHVPADRGVLPLDVPFDLPAAAELELYVGPGPQGRNNRDWASLGELTIQ